MMTNSSRNGGRPFKFVWFDAVYAESRFTDGEKAVLAYIAVLKVSTGGDTFCIRQSTLAGQCGICRRTVSSAVTRAKRLGYLTVSRPRARGWGRQGANELRLSLPKLSAEFAPNSAESCEESAHNSAELSARNEGASLDVV